ncbi:MAG TPA: aminotransferase class IV [Solirubrobacterales bacterium]|nr:aminotransferase class IV [Solirubrobacterales bacterium]
MTNPREGDPSEGVFETLLIAAGEPIELSSHLARLGASTEELYDEALPGGLADDAAERSRGLDLGRLKIVIAPGSGGLRQTLAVEEIDPRDHFPAWEQGAALHSVECEGGLGRHKWADRRRLPSLPEAALPLLVDRGQVLEASRANVFALVDGTLVTPAADGRILPGIARAGVLAAVAELGVTVAERSLSRDELLGAQEVFLTGSIRGVEPARSLDGTALPRPGDLGRQLGDALRRSWLGAPVAPR